MKCRPLHKWFIGFYKISPHSSEVYNYNRLIDNLCKADLMEDNNGIFSFKHRFVYYFFAARYLSINLHIPEIRAKVSALIARLYHEDFANILLFLTHHSKDSNLLTEIRDKAKSIFSETEPTRLESDTVHVDALIDEIPKQVYKNRDVKEYRRLKYEKKDALEKREDTDFKSEEIPDANGKIAALNLISQLNVACKNIEIIGQILKNYHGSIPGDLQVDLCEEAYFLGLRCLKEFFILLETKKENIIRNILARIRAQNIPDSEIEKNARRIMFHLYFVIAYGFIKAISEFIGAESLSVVINDILKKYEYLSVRLIDLAIKLDYFKAFPFNETKDLMMSITLRPPLRPAEHAKHKRFPLKVTFTIKNRLAYYILVDMVIDHLYMFPRDYPTKQQICTVVGIEMPRQRFIDKTSVVRKRD